MSTQIPGQHVARAIEREEIQVGCRGDVVHADVAHEIGAVVVVCGVDLQRLVGARWSSNDSLRLVVGRDNIWWKN